MKKLISILLALMLIFSLASLIGCAEEEPEKDDPAANDAADDSAADDSAADNAADDTADDAANSEYDGAPVTEYWGKSSPQLIAEGEKPLVGLTFPVLSDEYLIWLADSLETQLQEKGFDTMSVAAENDITKQIQQVENFHTMGAVGIIEAAMEIEALAACNTAAIEDGVVIVSLGSIPSNHEISGGIGTDWVNLGIAAAAHMVAYIDYAYPDAGDGEILTAFSQNSSLSNPKICSQYMREGLEADGRFNILFEKDLVMELETGYTFAEEALTFNPDITFFAMYIDAASVGVNNYLSSLPDVDYSKYAIFCTNGGETWKELLALSATNESAIRGSICYGGVDPAAGLFETSYKLLMGEEQAPFWIYEEFWAENCFGWEYEG